MTCSILFGEGIGGPKDANGCILAVGHSGPHEFISSSGESIEWETDLECDCEHCMACDGDYCAVYWKKPAQALNQGNAS